MEGPFYAVKKGRNAGIYNNWPDCQTQVSGYAGAVFKKFDDIYGARQFLNSDASNIIEKGPQVPSYYSEKNFKPKLDYNYSDGPIFYGIANGREVGVCDNWDSCKAMVYGFEGAKFRRFATLEEARLYVKSNAHLRTKPQNDRAVSSASSKKGPFYAVIFSNGDTAIFDTWEDCLKATKGVPNVVFKKFDSINEAEQFIGTNQNPGRKVKSDEALVNEYLQHHSKNDLRRQRSQKVTEVFTDGSYLPEYGSVGGIGIFFGYGDSRNVSEPLRNVNDSYSPEVNALLRVMVIISKELDVHVKNRSSVFPKYKIYSDSEAAVSVVNAYGNTWTEADFKRRAEGKKLRQILIHYNRIKSFYEDHATLFNNFDFKVEWVRGHDYNEGNEMADMLAKDGANQIAW